MEPRVIYKEIILNYEDHINYHISSNQNLSKNSISKKFYDNIIT